MRGLTISFIAAAAIAGSATWASAQPQQAGVSAAVRGQVALARESDNIVGRQVQSGDPIFLGDAITSGGASGIQIMLLDETVFSIGPNSEIAIDEFVYDPATDSGKVTASVAKGVFRFITGKIAQKRPEDMTVRLPTATIGIRGTIVAGAVRSGEGDDTAIDAVFNGLKGVVANAENAKDFVVLLGPGNENNTNDRGGAFVFSPNAPERAESGLSAGAPPPGGLGGGFGTNDVTVSRTGGAVVGYGGGQVSPSFFAPPEVSQGVTNGVSAQPASGPKGSPTDSNAQEANNTPIESADSLAGSDIAEGTQVAELQSGIETKQEDSAEAECPTCDGGNTVFDFNDLRAIDSGSASFSGSLNMGPFSVSSSFFQVNFGNTTFQFDMQGINGGGLSGAQIGCFSACNVNYGGLSGPAVFTQADANPGQTVNCDSCGLTMQFTSSESLNVTLEHQGNVGSTAVNLQ